MPYKNIEDRRARLKELRKRHPDKEYKAYKEKVLKTCSPEKQEHYKRLWAKKELPQRKLEIAMEALSSIEYECPNCTPALRRIVGNAFAKIKELKWS